jgi:hypothetical protein
VSATIEAQDDLVGSARQYLRDFPQYFEEAYQPIQQSTIRLGHPLISEIEISDAVSGDEVTEFDINWRNGILKLNDPSATPEGIYVRGYNYEWFLDEDLAYFADVVVTEHMATSGGSFTDMAPEERHVVAIGTVVNALWSLLTEFSTQIDVSTPEGMMIPAHMRFQQVLQLYQYWKGRYDEMAAATNTGLNAIGIMPLRRVSRLTNRLVPIFREREIDDPTPPVRVWPPIPEIVPTPEEGGPGPNGTGHGWYV